MTRSEDGIGMMNIAEPVVLVDTYRQAIKVRIVFWILLTIGVLSLWGGWTVFQTFGLSAADGGVLRPLWQRVALGGFVAGLGLAAAVGMWLYAGLYVLHISRVVDRITIITMSPFGRRNWEYPISEVGESAYHHGRVHHVLASGASGGLWVNAPWITLRMVGRRLPFIIDLQAEIIDIAALSVLAEGGVEEWQQEQQ